MEPFAITDINSFEILFNKLNSELILEREHLKAAREEIMALKIKTNELECDVNEKTKRLASIQDKTDLKGQFYDKMEKRNSHLETENKSMKLQLQILGSTNEQLKKLMQSVEAEKNRISNQNQSLKSEVEGYQKFKKELIENANNINETICSLKIKLNDYKEKHDMFVKDSSELPNNHDIQRANNALQTMLDKTLEEKTFFQERYCYYKALTAQLQNCIDSNNTQDDIEFFYEKWKQTCDKSNEIIGIITEHNSILQDIAKAKNDV